MAAALRQTFRETDLIARLGGDEFCVVAQADPDADPKAFVGRLAPRSPRAAPDSICR